MNKLAADIMHVHDIPVLDAYAVSGPPTHPPQPAQSASSQPSSHDRADCCNTCAAAMPSGGGRVGLGEQFSGLGTAFRRHAYARAGVKFTVNSQPKVNKLN
jgi:hypothetical protein